MNIRGSDRNSYPDIIVAKAKDNWQPIETAPDCEEKVLKHPKSGKKYSQKVPVQIIVYKGDFVCQSCKLPDGRFEKFSKNHPPEGWQHLPSAPKE